MDDEQPTDPAPARGTPGPGTPDAGTPDAGTPDAGTPYAGTPYAGTHGPGTPGSTNGGCIVLAATPIGNMGDASARLIEWLGSADLIAAEDTRRLHRLVQSLRVEVTGRVISYHEHNEAARTGELLEQVLAGKTLLMVTDAGMPAVSDPGFRLVQAAVEAGVRVTAAPGPSAVLTALALSGLPTDRFCFEGFLPRKAGERSARLTELAAERRTMVFFEAPHRLEVMLRALHEAFGPQRRAAVARELTKTYEEVLRGPLLELLEWAEAGDVRGEIAVVVAGAGEGTAVDPAEAVAAVNALVASGLRLKDAVAAVAEESRLSKRDLYSAVLAARTGPS